MKQMQNKIETYEQILSFLKAGKDLKKVTRYAETVNLLFNAFEYMDWVGFYEKDPSKDELYLSVYVGSEACEKIDINRGVCGKCYRDKETQLVSDVRTIPYHIACSSSTISEIVIPIFDKGECIAVLDIDSDIENAFDEIDEKYLKEIASILSC